jgi:hypothetical protein
MSSIILTIAEIVVDPRAISFMVELTFNTTSLPTTEDSYAEFANPLARREFLQLFCGAAETSAILAVVYSIEVA